jgi:hypothetical protein
MKCRILTINVIGFINQEKERILMKRKFVAALMALLTAILITSTVFAGAIKLRGVSFRLGSLIADGTLTGLGNQEVKVYLDASGFPVVSCTNHGGNQAPGQNPPKVSASGEQLVVGFDLSKKNGKSPFDVETEDPQIVDSIEYGCPNDNWTAQIEFIYWTDATISVVDPASEEVLLRQDFTCETTLTTVNCKPVK